MKENVIKAIFWGLTISIGLIIIDVIRTNGLSFISSILGGIVMGVLEFILSIVTKPRKS